MWNAILIELFAFALFSGLSLVFFDKKGQPLIRRDSLDDALFFLLGVLVYSRVSGFIAAHVYTPPLAKAVSAWPVGVQALVLLVVYDFIQYWLHRLFHGRRLWVFHAVHHSAEEIDILTSYRMHPVNFLFYTGLPTALLLMAGVTPQAFAVLVPFNYLMGCLTHANLRWDWGPLRAVLASPMYHRWHHADLGPERACNFAPNFPLWDILFGTYYMPKGESPVAFGAKEVPTNFARQLIYPIKV
jgi:sterol desaturase/sphingolipid hydroxylase (fatty acid hydroxylase superfamily)